MTTLSLLDEANFPEIYRLFLCAAQNMAYEKDQSMYCHALVLREALHHAIKTIEYHENTSEPNHYKEVAHLCFWMIKLKPMQPTVAFGNRFMQHYLRKSPKLLAVYLALKAETEDDKDQTKCQEFKENDINEVAVMHFALLVVAFLEKQIVELGNTPEKILAGENTTTLSEQETANLSEDQIRIEIGKKIKKKTAYFDRRVKKLEAYIPTMAHSFREHNYSARAMAMVFEMAFSTELL